MERNSWGFSLFCDDIRMEVGGKISVMGVYQADMILPQEPPFTLAKFAILVKYYELPDVFHDDVLLKVYLPGDQKDAPSVSRQVPRQALQIAIPDYKWDPDQERVFNLTIPLIFTGLLIANEGFLKVRAVCGDVVTNLGSLMVRKIGQNEKILGINA
jgi:hypothetical protein